MKRNSDNLRKLPLHSLRVRLFVSASLGVRIRTPGEGELYRNHYEEPRPSKLKNRLTLTDIQTSVR
jgi:hypothetical protein